MIFSPVAFEDAFPESSVAFIDTSLDLDGFFPSKHSPNVN